MKNIILLIILYVGFIADYVVNKLLTGNLDLDGLGDFNVAVSIATFFSVLFILGGDSGLNWFIPKYLENREWEKIKGYIVYYLKLTLIICLCAGIISLAADFFLRYYHLEKLLHESYFAMILTPALSVLTILGALLLAMHRQYLSSLTTELLKPLLFLAAIFTWLSVNKTINEYKAIALLLSSVLLTVMVQAWLSLRSVPFDFFSQKLQLCIAEWRKACIPMLMTDMSNNFISVLEIWSLELLHPDEKSVGVFSLLVFISSIIWVNFTVVYYYISSRIATIENDRPALQKYYTSSAFRLLLINIVTATMLMLNARSILAWFHPDMIAYSNWLNFILVGTSINALLRLASPFLRLTGYAREASDISARTLVISIVGTPAIIAVFGIEGAMVSLVGIHFIRGLWYSVSLKTSQGISLV
jgi:O-antigen/teichoic acid export membrane protein